MKTVLIIASALGLSVSGAMAMENCARKNTVASIDKEITTASVSKGERLGAEVATNVKQEERKSAE